MTEIGDNAECIMTKVKAIQGMDTNHLIFAFKGDGPMNGQVMIDH